mmetsp:Transcript_21412/g.47474  ORF Transcript_21412/g.47474 Transcript_21412/m.47474 type:complete len:281 (+) Transcript_21412:120-962(+)
MRLALSHIHADSSFNVSFCSRNSLFSSFSFCSSAVFPIFFAFLSSFFALIISLALAPETFWSNQYICSCLGILRQCLVPQLQQKYGQEKPMPHNLQGAMHTQPGGLRQGRPQEALQQLRQAIFLTQHLKHLVQGLQILKQGVHNLSMQSMKHLRHFLKQSLHFLKRPQMKRTGHMMQPKRSFQVHLMHFLRLMKQFAMHLTMAPKQVLKSESLKHGQYTNSGPMQHTETLRKASSKYSGRLASMIRLSTSFPSVSFHACLSGATAMATELWGYRRNSRGL